MANCVICNCELSNGAFNLKDKYELFNHSFICKTCANKIGIKNMFSASTYTAEKAKQKYFELYPEDSDKRKGKDCLNNDYILKLMHEGRRVEAHKYVVTEGAMGQNDAMYYIEGLLRNERKEQKEVNVQADEEFIAKIKAIPNSDTTWTAKEIRYLRTVLAEGEEVLDVVSGVMSQNNVNISGNYRESSATTSTNTRTWLMALTDKRIILINRHLLVGTEYIEIPLDVVNSVSAQSRLLLSSISIMHGSGGVIVNNILKGCEKPFVDRANAAMKKIKNASTDAIVNAINGSNNKVISVADELIKLKGLLDQGVITREEFDSQKSKLL